MIFCSCFFLWFVSLRLAFLVDSQWLGLIEANGPGNYANAGYLIYLIVNLGNKFLKNGLQSLNLRAKNNFWLVFFWFFLFDYLHRYIKNGVIHIFSFIHPGLYTVSVLFSCPVPEEAPTQVGMKIQTFSFCISC